MTATAYPWTAHWEDDPERTREVKRRCRRCAKFLRWAPWVAVVSPRGVEHAGADQGETACGLDATGSEWWWAA